MIKHQHKLLMFHLIKNLNPKLRLQLYLLKMNLKPELSEKGELLSARIAAGVAVMGAIMRASDPAMPVYEILKQWHAGEEDDARF